MATHRMRDLAAQIVDLQQELDREIEERRKELGLRFRGRLAEFEQGVTLRHKRLKQSAAQFFVQSNLFSLLTAPVIYSMIVPLALLDLWATVYQHICFHAYRIPRVRRSDYVVLDRHRLSYLNWIEALNCAYCGYGNGVIAYVREIASRTEQFWCPIKHALRVQDPHQRYYEFLEYGDADGYRERLGQFREALRKGDERTPPPVAGMELAKEQSV
ncbi:MAG TPA: hypothetical protein VGD10_04310 [Allosphingosinicella sp.]|uniref:hypothetical protein n=1 Tax=Allosphingosinicella sp. TaxID=2823234 RepID=UPI002ED8570B